MLGIFDVIRLSTATIYFFFTIGGFNIGTEELTSIGKCIVSATNVINPGSIDVGVDGLIKLNGQKTDVSRGTFSIEGLFNDSANGGLVNEVAFNGYGSVGTDTNGDWNPGVDLTNNAAASSEIFVTPFQLILTNSTAYFDQEGLGTSNVVTRAVFIQNFNPNVSSKIYINPNFNQNALAFATGTGHVEWDGVYQDPASGNLVTNYLYLIDDYLLGASTNVAILNGVPDNYTIISSTTPLLTNNTAAGFLSIFPNAFITNPFSLFERRNSGGIGGHQPEPGKSKRHSLTNLPGQMVYIAGTNDLNLNYTKVAGENYLSIYGPTQF